MIGRRDFITALAALIAPQGKALAPVDPPPASVRRVLLAAPASPPAVSSVAVIPTQVIDLILPYGMSDKGAAYNRTDFNFVQPTQPFQPNAQLQWAVRLDDLYVLHYFQGGPTETAITRVIEARRNGRPVLLWTLSHDLPGLANFAALQAEVRRLAP